MKRLLLILFGGILSANTAAFQQETTRVNLNGVIIVPACAIAAEAQDQSIDLGVVDETRMASGAEPSYPFSIRLINCLTEEEKETNHTLAVTFMGQYEGTNPWFNLQGNSIGVGMKIKDQNDHIIQPGVAHSGYVLKNDDVLRYSASLVKTADYFKAGEVSATFSFIIDYK
ncbi:MAG: fimbrial protein [Serratia sp. (in: enterobacteria)]|uniref:fimbrial protein n=1 Tax=Serratia sp. (in: enterobacteria) TaxID=616 RepID=UPI003F4058A2